MITKKQTRMRKLPKLFFLSLLLFMTITATAQTRTVRGRVTSDQDNEPVSGASVQVKNRQIGTTTANDGSFSLNVPAGAVTLVISNVGYNPVERRVDASSSDIAISLKQNNNQLGEVVVTDL